MSKIRELVESERSLPVNSFKNRIINGGFNVWQRGTSFTFGASSGGYTADRIRTYNYSDGQFSIGKSEIDGYNSIKITVDTAVSDLTTSKYWYGFSYKFEGQHLYDLAKNGKNITISFLFKSNVVGVYNISLRNWTQDSNGNYNIDSYVTEFNYTQADIIQKVTATIPLDYAFQNPVQNDENIGFYLTIGFLNQGDYSTSTVNQWQAGSYLTTPSCVNWGTTAGNYIEITQLQVEERNYATEFEHVPYDVELQRCMRYYEIIDVQKLDSATGTNYCLASFEYRVPKRTAPSLTAMNPISGNYGVIYDYANSTDVAVTLNADRCIPVLGARLFYDSGTDRSGFYGRVFADAEL